MTPKGLAAWIDARTAEAAMPKGGICFVDGNHTYAGITDSGRVAILTPQRQTMFFRVAPGLEDGAPIRMVLESRPPSEANDRRSLTRAMAQVRGVLRAAVAARY